ncbi:MAG: trigger factor [Pseudomonadota bacterium]|jgi:trigger factor
MKTQLEKVSTLGRKLNIEVPAALVTSTLNDFYHGVQKQVELKGFRKGKAPIAMIKNLYADRVKNDVTQELLKVGFSKGLQEHKLEPVDYPEFEFDEVIDGKDFTFSANFEVRPEIELKTYEGLEVEKEIFSVDPKEMESILENIRNSRASSEDVTENRPAQKGDIAVIDFKGIIDGKPLDRGEGTDHPLELGTKSFIEGFEDGIIGMTVGQTKTLNLKFPENYHADLSGKAVDFEVTLKKLRKKVLPELSDEFVTSMSGAPSTVEDLKKNIMKDLEDRQNKKTDESLKENLLKKLISVNPVEIPQSLVREQKKLLVQDMQKQMANDGMAEQDFAEYKDKWDADFEKTAKQMIHVAYLVDAIAAKHELHCKKEDVDAKFEEYAKQTGIDIGRIREFYSKAESMNRMVHKITEEKVIGFLIEKSKIKEVPAKA